MYYNFLCLVLLLLVHQHVDRRFHGIGNHSPLPLGPLVEGKVHGECAYSRFLLTYDYVEPIVLVAMTIVEDPAPQTHGHAWRQEGVKAELGHPVALLPAVLHLVVLETEPLELDLHEPWVCQKKQKMEFHVLRVTNADCGMISSNNLILYSFCRQSYDSVYTALRTIMAEVIVVLLPISYNTVRPTAR